jgi:hypothetical protein
VNDIAHPYLGTRADADPRVSIAFENAAYHALPRHGGDAWAILAAKVRGVHWRQRMAERLLEDAALDPGERVEALLALAVRLGPGQIERLRARTPMGDGVARVLAAQGQRDASAARLHDLAGPDLDLKIEVNRDSPWTFARWSEQQAFADYRFEADGVRYRGLLLRPGDLILPNVNLDGNFVYSALSDPKSFCPHSAVFVIIEARGRRWPAVIETYEKGLRAVPLCMFLNARYISYAEIYRHRDLGGASVAHVSDVAHAALDEARGYNFNTLDDDRTYVCCTQVARQLYQDLGLPVPEAFGAILDPGVRDTMTRLDYPHLDVFFTPVDFVRSELLSFVGWVDNGQPAKLVARELVEQSFRERFSRGNLDPGRLPFMVRLLHFSIRQLRARTLLGRLVSAVTGFDHISLPKGPDRILALVEPLEAELGRAVRRILPDVERHLAQNDHLDLPAVLAHPGLRARADALLPMRWMGD